MTIWTGIRKELASARKDEWMATYIDPVQARVVDQALVLYVPNTFIAEAIAAERPAIRALLPDGLTDVIIRQGLARDDQPARSSAAKSAETPATSLPTSTLPASSGSQARRNRAAGDPESAVLQHVWPRDMRAMPSDLLRSSLFTINRYGPTATRPKRDKELLFSVSTFELRVTGEETNTFDADVHAQLLHYQRNQVFGTSIWFTLRELCEDLDLPPNGDNINRVRYSVERLRDTTVMLTHHDGAKPRDFKGQLVSSFVREGTQGHDRWYVQLDKYLVALLGPGVQARYHLETDRRLKSSLAKYLLRFYATHSSRIHPMKVETMRKFTGTQQPIREFRRALRNALDELVGVQAIESWGIEDDKVYINRAGEVPRLTACSER